MVVRTGRAVSGQPGGRAAPSGPIKAHVLIIEAPYYDDVSGALASGALAELEARGATFERIEVPGALEIPQVLAQVLAQNSTQVPRQTAAQSTLDTKSASARKFDGVIALGCVIRGETAHYDIVVNNANHWLMELAITNKIPLGNGILTVDTHDQAMARANGGRAGKGGDAAHACLRLVEIGRDFSGAGQ